MAICGLNVNLSSIQGDITAKISGFISLDDALEAPELLSSYKSTLLSGMSSMKSKIDTLVPDIPFSTSGLTSLRDQLTAYVSVPSVSGLADIASKFGGLTSLTGYANINLNDLASSALSLGASFDPCSLAGDLKIPNIVADASGALQALPSIQPDIGATYAAAKIALEDQTITDNLSLAIADNIPITADLGSAATEVIEENIVTAHTGMGDLVKKLPTGEEVVETKEEFIEEAKTYISLYDAEQALAADSGILGYGDRGGTAAALNYKTARKEAMDKYGEQNGLTGISKIRSFNKAVKSGEVVIPDERTPPRTTWY